MPAAGDRAGQRYWCAVACRQHVKLGLAGGFAQLGHGKQRPLERMKPGDGIVYYSPTETYGGNEKCQMFTSIGVVKDAGIYSFEMSPGFVPYRRDVEYFEAEDTPVQPLLPLLSFTRDRRNWGYRFRFGLFAIDREDFLLILSKMNPARGNHDLSSPVPGR
jgi:hypothetical protein